MKIFISYSRVDRDTCDRVTTFLSRYHDVWMDREDILPGEDWSRAITKGIKNCDVFLFLASHSSVVSPHCNAEINAALKFKKDVIPVMLDNLVLPQELARLQWVFLDDFEEAMCEILASIKKPQSNLWQLICAVEAVALLISILL